MPVTETNIEQVQKQREKAAKAVTSGKSLQATSTGLGDILMEAVRGDRATRGVSKLATDTGNVMGQLVSDPANIRQFGSTEGTRMDPLAVDAATSDQRARNLRTLGTVSTQKAQNEGTLQEVIQAGANQMLAMAQQKFAEAEQYKSEADALMERLAYEADRADRAFDEYMATENMKKSGSGGSGTRAGDIKGFAEDAAGFQEAINSGKISYIDAVGKLKLAYPWATDEDIQMAIGTLDTNPALREELYAKGSAFKQPGQTQGFVGTANKVLDKLGSIFQGSYPWRR